MLGLLTGSLGAIILNILKGGIEYFQSGQKIKQDILDKKHELDLLKKQSQIQAGIDQAKIAVQVGIADAEAYSEAFKAREYSIRTAIRSDIWIVSLLSGLIRPVTTISYTIIFFFGLYISYSYAINEGLELIDYMKLPMISAFIELNYMIVGFWFMNREFSKYRRV